MNKPLNLKYYWFFTIGLILILVIAPLIQDGIFMDGMLYISVGKNLSQGIGTFWNQSFSKTCMFNYHEQPPLYGGLIALFFKIFGYSIYTERIFCFSFFALTLVVLSKFWKQLNLNKDQFKLDFLPILFFSITPVVFWAYQNHVEETVMTLFDLLAIYYIHQSLQNRGSVLIKLFFSSCFIVLATLTKGIQGIFPLMGFALFWLINPEFKNLKKYFVNTLYLFGFFTGIYSIIFFVFPDAYTSFENYFSIRLVNTFNHIGATTENRFYLLFKLVNELIPVAALSFILILLGKNKSRVSLINKEKRRELYWLILVGLSGSLPLMVTLEQRGFYLVTSLPYFALAFSLITVNYLTEIQLKSELIKKILRLFSIVVLFIGISYSFFSIGKTKRDKELLHDIYLCKSILKHGDTIGVPENMWNDWNLQTYMVRYYYVSLSMAKNNTYYIIRKDLDKSIVPENYQLLKLTTQFFDVYELKKNKS